MNENQQSEAILPEELLIDYPREEYNSTLISDNNKVYQIQNKNNKELIICKRITS